MRHARYVEDVLKKAIHNQDSIPQDKEIMGYEGILKCCLDRDCEGDSGPLYLCPKCGVVRIF